MKLLARKCLRFLADERGSATAEYAVLSAMTWLISFGVGSQLREAQAEFNDTLTITIEHAYEDALTP